MMPRDLDGQIDSGLPGGFGKDEDRVVAAAQVGRPPVPVAIDRVTVDLGLAGPYLREEVAEVPGPHHHQAGLVPRIRDVCQEVQLRTRVGHGRQSGERDDHLCFIIPRQSYICQGSS